MKSLMNEYQKIKIKLMNSKIITTTSFFLLLIVSACSGDKKEKSTTELPPVSVEIQEVVSGSNAKFISASGTLESEKRAVISTRMMGYITALKVQTGQNVRKGQLLVSINNDDIQAKKVQAEAGVIQAQTSYNSAKKDWERFTALFKQQSASQKELDNVTTQYQMAQAGFEAAKAMRNEVMAQFAYASLTAPFDGTITETFVKQGDMANPGAPLVTIEGGGELHAVVSVSESDILKIKNGLVADVLLKSSKVTLTGKVIEISTSSHNSNGQYAVKLALDGKKDKALSGMFINATFPIDKAETTTETAVVLVPKSAIIVQGQLSGIYTVNAENTALLRWLRLGKTYGENIEVLSGLSAGEKYVVKAEGKLFNGSKVTLK
jgi:RND family efflux transporter MFP subunit